ncbi:BTAD domain-containing putative transcriptional regulator [Streptomyces sp. NPDC059989]|uniref:AfsR/SARP family transcriptional regulator n=1 Tax=Streptomyces sp. NPDC059989 TaxID=3347026 RepID=UPI003694DCAF
MDIDVLGGLEVLENGVPIAPATPPARQVLAMLAAHADQVVPVAVLAEELAVLVPPEHARAALDSCVRLVRQRVAAAAAPGGGRTAESVLLQTPGGYLLDTGNGRSDLHEFAREAGAGYRAMARGDHESAARRLRGALRLWKGPAFDGVTPGPRLGERIAELEATRKAVAEQWVEAELALGRHREIRSELAELTPIPGISGLRETDSGWGRRRGTVPPWEAARTAVRTAPYPSRPTRTPSRGAAGRDETYRELAAVVRADFGRGSAVADGPLRRSPRRGAPAPSLA